jgi:glutathione S-transferase
VPEPPLYPADRERRAAVEEAERFGDEELQAPAANRLERAPPRSLAAPKLRRACARLGVSTDLAVKTSAPIVALAVRFNETSDAKVRADLAALPEMLDHVDGWIADGVLGGAEPNAADLQIATSLRLLMTMDDLRGAIEARPAGELATRVIPEFPGRVPPILPEEWLGAMREGAPA